MAQLYNYKQEKLTSEDQFNTLERGIGRGKALVKFYSQFTSDFKNKEVLDIGCGLGSVTLEFSELFKQVNSIDVDPICVSTTQKRVELNKKKNVLVQSGSALKIPLKDSAVDHVSMNGVFEWVRQGAPQLSAKRAQMKTLAEVSRVLDTNGYLVVGIENRGFPYFWLSDPHTSFPVIVILPEFLRDFVFKIVHGTKFLPAIYSYWTYKRMFTKQFGNAKLYVPLPHYQFPYEVADLNKPSEIIEKCNKVLREHKLKRAHKWGIIFTKWATRLRLHKLLVPGFMIVSQKRQKKQ